MLNVSRDNAAAVRGEAAHSGSFNPLLNRQMVQSRSREGRLDVDALLQSISAHYDSLEAERRGVVRSMQLMSEEAQALTREIRERTSSHLQAIMDNVKDAIITVDDAGHIETFNPTGERIFGFAAAEVMGRKLDFLLPDLTSRDASLLEFLERSATTIDDTHVDLAAQQTWGRSKEKNRVAVEIAVSKASLNRRDGYIVCVRDCTDRTRSEAIAAGERRVFEKIAANAPLPAVLEALCEVIERVMPQSFCAVNLLDSERQALTFDVAPSLPREFVAAMDLTPVGTRFGSSAAAVSLARQVTVVDIATDGLWECRRAAAMHAGLHGSWAAPILASDGPIVGTFAVYFRNVGLPPARDHELLLRMTQIAGIAIERRSAEEARERALVTLQSIGDAVITTDSEGRIDYMNPVAESLTGWESREAQSLQICDIFTVVDEATRTPSESPVLRCLREGRVLGLAEHTIKVVRRAREITIQDSAAPIRDRAGNLIGAVMVFHDISKERRLHRALHYQASHDALTGLINRREFDNRLAAAVESIRADSNCRHALLYLDLDQFKLVNDTCGHPAGDLLLKQITGVLQSRVRGEDTLARLGGDEFGILLQSCSLDQALRIAETLRQAIRDYRFTWQDGVYAVGVSIGIVEITRDTPTVANVMSAADVACYAAKDQGRNRVQLYKPDNVPERHREMQWVAKLTRACDEGRFEIYYQPIVPIGANRHECEHFELMLRLRDESGALVLPAEFIPAAERYNVMPSIDRWVVGQVLDLLVYRGGEGIRPFTVAVNLSGTSLNDERFLEYLIAELGARALPPGAMCFEITETAAISNLGNVVHFMRELKARGCHFALDDFGSGLSSFMYLKTLPVDYLKIDGQFIENVVRDPVDRSMVEAIGQIGRAMGIHTIAERVESVEVLVELGRLGIGFAQGYHIAAPRPASEFPYRYA
jgi:diguanylate cyclase (GGDEF)-like protein/PAS domain S-box-containing protein